jgi:hypothetical protein
VEVPLAGMSYNPSFEDHQRIIDMAAKVEEEKEKVRLYFNFCFQDNGNRGSILSNAMVS